MNVIVLEDDSNRIKKFREWFPSALIFDTAEECIKNLSKGCEVLFLDHDLGGEIYVDVNNKNTGSEVARWIAREKPKIDQIIIHSYNFPASESMKETLLNEKYKVRSIPFNSSWIFK